MDTLFFDKLKDAGVDVDTAIKRFMGKEDLYLKFLAKYQNDESAANIEKYLAEKNVEEAFKSAHTLKGVAGNLGLDPIAKYASEMVELLRGKDQLEEIDADQLSSVSGELQAVHRSLLTILAEL